MCFSAILGRSLPLQASALAFEKREMNAGAYKQDNILAITGKHAKLDIKKRPAILMFFV